MSALIQEVSTSNQSDYSNNASVISSFVEDSCLFKQQKGAKSMVSYLP